MPVAMTWRPRGAVIFALPSLRDRLGAFQDACGSRPHILRKFSILTRGAARCYRTQRRCSVFPSDGLAGNSLLIGLKDQRELSLDGSAAIGA
jgi:hypothetical protein